MLLNVAPGTMCIGDVISRAVSGLYLASPFVGQQALGGSVDPRVFVDAIGQPVVGAAVVVVVVVEACAASTPQRT
jgi:hypothetical protein